MAAIATADTWISFWNQLPQEQLLFRPEAEEYVRNFTHFRGRWTAVLTPLQGAPR